MPEVAPPQADAGFTPFSTLHLLAVAIALLIVVGLTLAGRAARASPPAERTLRLAWALSVLAAQALTITWWLLPANFDPGVSFPLHVCDLAAILTAPALLLERRWLHTLLYFWGLGLSTQAFITPVITVGPGHTEFWLFWTQHTQVAASGVYLVAVLAYRPRLRDTLTTIGISLAYVGVMLPIDAAFAFNYGYVGPTPPEQPTLLDLLGPWPLRLLPLIALGITAYLFLWAIWPLADRIRRSVRIRT